MLGRVPQSGLQKAASDPRYIALYRRACERLDSYLDQSERRSSMLVAYFSMEYGLTECLPIYSGGLGVLSGDHMKGSATPTCRSSASDCSTRRDTTSRS